MFSVIYSIPGFAVVNKPFDVAMDTDNSSSTTLATKNESPPAFTVQSWAESDPQNLLKIAKNPPASVDDDRDEVSSRRRNTKDTIDGKVRFVHQLDFSTSGLLCLA